MSEKVDKDRNWQWLSKSDLITETEALECAALGQTIRTNYEKSYINKTSENPLCRLYGKNSESVQQLVSGRKNCKKNELEHTEKWYGHAPEGAVENEEVKVLWDINVQCEKVIEARRQT